MTRAVLFLALVLAGCSCDTRGDPGRDAGPPRVGVDSGPPSLFDSGPPGDAGPPGDPNCANAAAQFLYVIDSSDVLLRYDPEANTLTSLGAVDCPTTSSPFSMAVDRDANAWVAYQDGNLFRVSVADLTCTATSFTPNQAGFEVFGMGYVADAPGSTEETLFVSGGSLLDVSLGTADLGRIDDSLVLTPIGALPGWPELTGTGDAELWGFFPDTAPPSVRRIDTATGGTAQSFPINEIGGGLGLGDRAWAFAFWGGLFHIFYKGELDATTNVWRLNPEDGSVVEMIHESGYRIVGAGVSTCAPVDLI